MTKVLTSLRCLYFPSSRFDVANHSSVWCKLLQYLSDLFADYSTCLILAFTVERCIAAYLPTQFKRVGSNAFPTINNSLMMDRMGLTPVAQTGLRALLC